MYLKRPPHILRKIFSDFKWSLETSDKEVALTFDDGPYPEITPWILDLLSERQLKATFFCVGKQVEAHPGIYQHIIDQGHRVGNHSYSHLSAWSTSRQIFESDIEKCKQVVDTSIFRPPYGRFYPGSWIKRDYQVVMWDFLSGDFDSKVKAEDCLQICKSYTRPGSIVVFHDKPDCAEKLKTVLPSYLDHLQESGYSCRTL